MAPLTLELDGAAPEAYEMEMRTPNPSTESTFFLPWVARAQESELLSTPPGTRRVMSGNQLSLDSPSTLSLRHECATKKSPLVVIGAGRDGVEGLQDMVDESAVQWALIRFELGGGSFVRHKLVFLHFNGEDCPAMRRGQANALTSDAQNLLRKSNSKSNQEGFHASLSLTRKDEVTADQILDRVSKFFVKDDIDFSWQKKTSGKEAQAQKPPNLKGAGDSGEGDQRCCRLPGNADVSQKYTGREALRAVGDPLGPWNWVMVHSEPDALPLASGGAGSVEELSEFLAQSQDKVLSGLLRMGFGVGRLRRTKHVLVHWVGESVPAVARGRLIARRPEMEKVLGAGVACSVSLELTRLEDLTLEDVIERVRRSSIVDDGILDRDKPQQNAFSVESFRQALREEQARAPPEELVALPKKYTEWADWDVEDVVALMHADDGPLTWALFGPRNAGRLQRGLSSGGGWAGTPNTPLSGSPLSGASPQPAWSKLMVTPPRSFR